ncbi:transcriptional repressor NF-X1 homolog isoform X1 [Lucilia cuprina]|uniref:transcriptional repressor NF-X1 homolog isoform X1 n=1 Tax=Lucilia cuprina TaxID=7375 RepID=UPI001F056500|nr:transcriptional repressor NF-X1 homolog isoform X1 [Lucilia cuprina]
MIVDKKGQQAALAEDFNQINLNNINLNITTTTTTSTTTSTNTEAIEDLAIITTRTTVQHSQYKNQTKSMAQSPINKRRHTALPHSLIMNQTQQQQQQHHSHSTAQNHIIEELIDLELLETKPILRKSLSTPAFNALETQHPLKSEVTIIINHNHHQQQQQQPQQHQKQQHHHHQQSLQQQQHKHHHHHNQHHCQVHTKNMINLNNHKSTISNNNCNNLSATKTTTTSNNNNNNATTTIANNNSNSSSSSSSPPDTTTTTSLNQRLGCAHYKRRAMFVTPCCNKFYKCRFCHDENETHHFDRKTLTELICSECNTRQKVQERCQNCGIRFGKYTCLICNLFDDSNKRQYHCDQCGICRIGGRENFFHCKVCNMCLPIQLKIDGHRCVENISRSHCPVCLGDIHTSRIPCHIPDCGHLLHKMCFDQLLTSGHYTCPTCQTSLIDMTALWEYLDAQAELMPIPKKYENQRIHIFCNDCHKTSKTKFHFIGLKCVNCGAYNTTQDVKRRMSLVTDESTSA